MVPFAKVVTYNKLRETPSGNLVSKAMLQVVVSVCKAVDGCRLIWPAGTPYSKARSLNQIQRMRVDREQSCSPREAGLRDDKDRAVRQQDPLRHSLPPDVRPRPLGLHLDDGGMDSTEVGGDKLRGQARTSTQLQREQVDQVAV